MRVLILHPNYPGQFRDRASFFVAQGCQVTFVCQTSSAPALAGLKLLRLKGKLGVKPLATSSQSPTQQARTRAKQYRVALEHMQQAGYQPDLIISHAGWGAGLFSHRLWPDSFRIAYSEWFFGMEDTMVAYNRDCRWPLVSYRSKTPQRQLRKKPDRDAAILYELCHADVIVAPTHWQKLQLPKPMRRVCQVIYDGIDLAKYANRALLPDIDADRFLLTYGTRGMEPMRGFPDFIDELDQCLELYDQLDVQIAGKDEMCYDKVPPPHSKSWGEWAQVRLRRWVQNGRVKFLGRMNYDRYRRWLANSSVHVYLTQPYVGSWSLLESMASGCCLIASDVQPVREFLDEHSATLVDHRQPGWLCGALGSLLPNPALRSAKSTAAQRLSRLYPRERSDRMWQSLTRHTMPLLLD